MGFDGNGTTTPNGLVATDAFGYSLDYYNGDYRGVGGSQFLAEEAPGDAFVTASLNGGLYNGNIARMVTALSDTGEVPMDVVGNAYTYDQLNRLILKEAFTRAGMHLPGNDNWTGISSTTNYKERFAYDANGNILGLVRYAEGSNPMDGLTYHYYKGTNKLRYVRDATADGDYAGDIDDQDTLSMFGADTVNYFYDKNGNLVFDAAEQIDTIRWTVSGKIDAVIRRPGSARPNLYFYYDPMGNRSVKEVVQSNGNKKYEFYKRDATGNILATYSITDNSGSKELKLDEQVIYGSSRLGVIGEELLIAENSNWPDYVLTDDTANAPFVVWNADSTYLDTTFVNPFDSVDYKIKVNKYLGHRKYELSNHLGNVLAVISDRKYGVDDDNNGAIEMYKPDVLSETDYYAFGSSIKERSVSGAGYKFGFNGQEKDDEIYGEGNANTAMFWEYDTRLGRRWNLDPVKYEGLSSYSTFNDNPIANFDINGDDWHIKKSTDKETGRERYDITINAKVMNNSKKVMSDKDLEKLSISIKTQIEKTYSFENKDIIVSAKVNISTLNSKQTMLEANGIGTTTDHIFSIVDQKELGSKSNPSGKGVIADGQFGGRLVRIGTDGVDHIRDNVNKRTIPHELGHTGYLQHPHAQSSQTKNNPFAHYPYEYVHPTAFKSNLMSQSWFSNGTKITNSQIRLLYVNYTNGVLNKQK